MLGVAAGNPAVVTDGGYEIVQPRSPIQPMGKVAGNMVTSGENDGTAKGKWDRMPGAKSYEVETASHPGGPWTHHSTVTVTHVDFTGLTSGQKVWTRVRAINKLGPGAWSDPACCTVP